MLTAAPPATPRPGSHPLPYECRAAAYPMNEAHSIPLRSHETTSPCLALRWLRECTQHITDQLDAAYAQPGLYWLTDEAEHERALAYMTCGMGYQLTLHDDSTRYVLLAYPAGSTQATRGYWCERWTQDVSTTERPALLASFDAYSAPQADRRVAIALRTISPALDTDASDPAWAWLYEERAETEGPCCARNLAR